MRTKVVSQLVHKGRVVTMRAVQVEEHARRADPADAREAVSRAARNHGDPEIVMVLKKSLTRVEACRLW